MEKKRQMAKDKFYELDAKTLANMYSPYKDVKYTITYTPQRVVIDKLLNDLHTMQLDYVDEAVYMSDLREANEVIKHIMEKK